MAISFGVFSLLQYRVWYDRFLKHVFSYVGHVLTLRIRELTTTDST